MSPKQNPVAIIAADVPARTKPTAYPEPFASRMAGREKRQLGDFFGLTNFGVNLTRLAPNAVSALRHSHTRQDEFIYVLQGRPTLQTDEGRTQLSPGMCAGFKAGTGNGHRLINETTGEVVYSKSATERREMKVTIPMTISKPCSWTESGSSFTRTAHRMREADHDQ